MSRPRLIVILATMRSGSNLLERILVQHPDLVLEGELFNKNFIGRVGVDRVHGADIAARNEDPGKFLDRVADINQGYTPVFRYFHDHETSALGPILDDPTIGKIILRRSTFDSYVSLQVARQTDQWMKGRRATKTKPTKITFDVDDYAQWARDVTAYYTDIEAQLSRNAQRAVTINYHQIKSLDVLNDVTDQFELSRRFSYFFEPVKKQLADDPSAHIANPDAALHIPRERPAPEAPRNHAPVIETIQFAANLGLAYLPIMGTHENDDLKNLELSNGAPLIPLSLSALTRAQDNGTLPQRIYTRVIDPQERLAELFVRASDPNNRLISIPLSKFIGIDVPDLTQVKHPPKKRWAGFSRREYRQAMRAFAIALRKELWGGGRRFVISDLLWPQALLIQNIQMSIDLTILIGNGYPDDAPFSQLSRQTTKREHEGVPYELGSFYGKIDAPIHDLFREDYERFFNGS